jgi:IS30 family transposase
MVSRVSLGGHRYALTVVDERADMHYVRLLKDKTCALDGMREIAAEMRAATKREVIQWTFDRGTEFLNKDARSHARDKLPGASTFYSNVEHPWENGLAERSFSVIFAIARALLHDAQCPNHPWGHAILHACYLCNRRPSKKCGGKSPAHYATGAPADLSKLRAFGCPAMAHVRERQRSDPKLDHIALH